jgi:flavin-dependent dehydrogenase
MRGEEVKWIKIEERMPTKEERDFSEIVWWNREEDKPYCGFFYHYDGSKIKVCARDWAIDMPLSDFTHWAVVTPPEGME